MGNWIFFVRFECNRVFHVLYDVSCTVCCVAEYCNGVDGNYFILTLGFVLILDFLF